MVNQWGGLVEIALAIITLAFFALVFNKSSNANAIISTTGQSFGGLLKFVTLQG